MREHPPVGGWHVSWGACVQYGPLLASSPYTNQRIFRVYGPEDAPARIETLKTIQFGPSHNPLILPRPARTPQAPKAPQSSRPSETHWFWTPRSEYRPPGRVSPGRGWHAECIERSA